MRDSQIIFEHSDGDSFVVSMFGNAEQLHKLATAIRDGTLKKVTVETETKLYERAAYDLSKKTVASL